MRNVALEKEIHAHSKVVLGLECGPQISPRDVCSKFFFSIPKPFELWLWRDINSSVAWVAWTICLGIGSETLLIWNGPGCLWKWLVGGAVRIWLLFGNEVSTPNWCNSRVNWRSTSERSTLIYFRGLLRPLYGVPTPLLLTMGAMGPFLRPHRESTVPILSNFEYPGESFCVSVSTFATWLSPGRWGIRTESARLFRRGNRGLMSDYPWIVMRKIMIFLLGLRNMQLSCIFD